MEGRSERMRQGERGGTVKGGRMEGEREEGGE